MEDNVNGLDNVVRLPTKYHDEWKYVYVSPLYSEVGIWLMHTSTDWNAASSLWALIPSFLREVENDSDIIDATIEDLAAEAETEPAKIVEILNRLVGLEVIECREAADGRPPRYYMNPWVASKKSMTDGDIIRARTAKPVVPALPQKPKRKRAPRKVASTR